MMIVALFLSSMFAYSTRHWVIGSVILVATFLAVM